MQKMLGTKYFCSSEGIAATLDSDQGLNPEIVCYSEHMKRPHRNYSHVKRARTRAKVLHTVKVKPAFFLELALNRQSLRTMVSIEHLQLFPQDAVSTVAD